MQRFQGVCVIASASKPCSVSVWMSKKIEKRKKENPSVLLKTVSEGGKRRKEKSEREKIYIYIYIYRERERERNTETQRKRDRERKQILR